MIYYFSNVHESTVIAQAEAPASHLSALADGFAIDDWIGIQEHSVVRMHLQS